MQVFGFHNAFSTLYPTYDFSYKDSRLGRVCSALKKADWVNPFYRTIEARKNPYETQQRAFNQRRPPNSPHKEKPLQGSRASPESTMLLEARQVEFDL